MRRYGLLAALLVVVVDQAVKLWVVFGVMAPPRVIEVTPFFNIVMVWNRGASFGMFSTDSAWSRYLLVAIALAISIGLLFWLLNARTRWLSVGLGCVIGGAVGNVIDRFAHGAVADFLDFHVSGYHWPAFNVADMAITIGVIMLLLDGLIGKRRDNRL